ncbi:MAG: tetratricopeptide repeat protein [Alphaproteobacteria bacterium]
MRRYRLFAAAALFALSVTTGPATADFAAATSAYDGGDYATAFREWRALAEAGDTEAQIALAGLYRGGIGRDVDLVRAAQWYARAALAGDAVAQLNLAEMYEHGWGVARDNVAAFIWYHRAAAQGRGWAADRRDRLAKRMKAAELAAARRRLSPSQ